MEKSLILFVKCANTKDIWDFCFGGLKYHQSFIG